MSHTEQNVECAIICLPALRLTKYVLGDKNEEITSCQQLLRALCVWDGRSGSACGTVSVAEMNWASAQLMANVDKIILESGYGCKVERSWRHDANIYVDE